MFYKNTLLIAFVFAAISVSAQTPPPPDYQGPVSVPAPSPTPTDRYVVVGESAGSDSSKDGKKISAGVLNGRARLLPKPAFPIEARNARVQGTVLVQTIIDEEGNVTGAQAISGHELLRSAAESAALGAKFGPTLLDGKPVKVSGVITYNFVLGTKLNEMVMHWGITLQVLRSPNAQAMLAKPIPEVVAIRFGLVPDELLEEKLPIEELGRALEAGRAKAIDSVTEAINRRAGVEEKWRFAVGTSLGNLRVEFNRLYREMDAGPGSSPNVSKTYRELKVIGELAANAPHTIPETLLTKMKALAAYSDHSDLLKVMPEMVAATSAVSR